MDKNLSKECFERMAALMTGIKFVFYVLIFWNKFIIHIYLCNIYSFWKIMPIGDKAELWSF